MKQINLYTNALEVNREKVELEKAVKALKALRSLLAEHGLSLTAKLAEDAAGDSVLIYDTLKSIAVRETAKAPAVLRVPMENQALSEIDKVLRAFKPLRSDLRLCSNFEGLIDYQTAEARPEAIDAIIDRNSLAVRTEAGLKLYEAHREIAAQLGELLKDIKYEYRTAFMDSLQHDWKNGGVHVEPFEYDSCVEEKS